MQGHRTLDDEPMADMNMVPFIDIALTLLIIMMVTTAFIHHPGVSLKLPETTTREGAPETNKDLTIVVSSDGSLYVDAQKMTTADVQAHLQQVAARDRNARILVKGDRAVLYGQMMNVMDMVRQAGLTRVVLPTDPKTLENSPPGAPSSQPRTALR